MKNPLELSESLIVEPTARNAHRFAQKELEKYADQPGAYGRLGGLVDAVGDHYHLRDDEKQWLTDKLKKHIESEPILYKGWLD